MLNELTDEIGEGGLLRIYSGTKPALGGAETTMLVEVPLSTPAAPYASDGILTFTAPADTEVTAAGDASWARICTSSGSYVSDLTVGVTDSGADLVFDTVSFNVGDTVRISLFRFTAGNGS